MRAGKFWAVLVGVEVLGGLSVFWQIDRNLQDY